MRAPRVKASTKALAAALTCATAGFALAALWPPSGTPAEVTVTAATGPLRAPVRPLLPAGADDPASSVAAAGADAAVPEPGVAAPSTYLPRADGEWQGMLVDTSVQPLCDTSARCGLGLACGDAGTCGPCRADGDCASGEACVLDHCVPQVAVECRTRADCAGDDTLCVLTGYSPDPRGNAAMRAICRPSTGGVADPPRELLAGEPAVPGPVAPEELLSSVDADARAAALSP